MTGLNNRQWSIWIYLLAAVGFTCISVVICGYRLGPQVNHEMQWTIIYKYWDPELYSTDPVVRIYLQAPTLFFAIIGKLVSPDRLESFMIALHLLSQFGCIAAMMGGVWKLRRQTPWAPLLAVFGICGMSEPLVGASPLMLNYVTPATVSAFFALAGLACVINRRWILGTILIGMTCGVHPLRGIYAWVAAMGWAAGLLWRAESGSRRGVLVKLGKTAIPGMILTLIFFMPFLSSAFESQGNAMPGWKEWLMSNFNIHYYPFRKSWDVELRLLCTLVLLFGLSNRRSLYSDPEFQSDRRNEDIADGLNWGTRWATAGILIWMIIGVLGTEAVQTGMFVRMQTARAASFLIPLLVWNLIGFLSMPLQSGRTQSLRLRWMRYCVIGLLLHIVYFAALRQQGGDILYLLSLNFTGLTIGMLLLIWMPPLQCQPSAALQRIAGTALGVVAFTPFLLILFMWFSRFLYSLLEFFLNILMFDPFVLYLNTPDADLLFIYGRYLFELSVLSCAIAGLLALCGKQRWVQGLNGTEIWQAGIAGCLTLFMLAMLNASLRMARNEGVIFTPRDQRCVEAAAWIRAQTPKDAMFLVYHDEFDYFRIRAMRGMLFKSSDDRLLYIDPASGNRLMEIVKALGNPSFSGSPNERAWRLSPQRAGAACIKYNCDYLVTRPGFLQEIEPVYRDQSVDVYHVQGLPVEAFR